MSKVVKSIERSYVDTETGEVLGAETTTVYSHGEEPPYVKMYIQDILYMADMERRYEALTRAMLKRIDYADRENGLCIELTMRKKKLILKEIGWKNVQSIDNGVQKLLKGKIIYRVERGVYRFNPYLFGRGDWKSIEKIRMQIDYNDIKGRSFQTNFKYKKTKDDEFWEEINKED